MPRRIYSDAFIDRQIAKVDAMNERSQVIVNYPQCMHTEEPTTWSRKTLNEWDRKEIQAYFKQQRDLAYVQGFWMGWVLRDGAKDA